MDERLDKSLKFSKYRQTLNNQIELLKRRKDSLLNFSTNGGTFLIRPELMFLVQKLIDAGRTESILLDKNNIPIKIDNLESFLEDIDDRYFNVINDYSTEYEKLRQARNVESILDLNEE